MKKTVTLGFMMIFASSTAMAYGYDYVDEMANRELVRIPVQSCPQFQPNAATHSILKLPLNPVKTATH